MQFFAGDEVLYSVADALLFTFHFSLYPSSHLSLSLPKNKPRHTEEAHGSVYQAVICSLRRRGYLPLEYPLRAVLDSINGYQQRGLHKGRLPQNCIEQVRYQGG